jgi:ankyrin repeat protein
MMCAARKGQAKAMKALIDAGAKLDAHGGPSMETALHIAAWSGKGAKKAVKLLAKHGADLEAEDEWGSGALMSAVACSEEDASALDVVSELVRLGARLDKKDKEGNTALHDAALHSDPACAKLLARAGASLAGFNEKGFDPLGLAFVAKNDETAVALLELGADWGAEYSVGDMMWLGLSGRVSAGSLALVRECSSAAEWIRSRDELEKLEDGVPAGKRSSMKQRGRL